MFARLFAAFKHDETPKKDVQNFGKGDGDASKGVPSVLTGAWQRPVTTGTWAQMHSAPLLPS